MESKPNSGKLSGMLGDILGQSAPDVILKLPCQVYREVTERAGGRGSVRSGHPDGLRVDTQGAIKPKGLTKKVYDLVLIVETF